MEGAETVISTVGLTGTSATITNYDIDLNGNINLLAEAKKAGVKNFVYISVIKAESAPDVPMLHAKYLFEEELKKFHPSLEIEDAEEAIYNQDMTDMADILVKMLKETKAEEE